MMRSFMPGGGRHGDGRIDSPEMKEKHAEYHKRTRFRDD